MNAPFAILGDSHVSAFLDGVREAGGQDLLVGGGWAPATRFMHRYFEIVDDRIEPHAETMHYGRWLAVTQAQGLADFRGRLIVSLGLASAPFYGSRMWRQFGHGRIPISAALTAAIIDDMQRENVRFYEALIARDLIAAAYVSPPPQRRHAAFKYVAKPQVDRLTEMYHAPILAVLQAANVPLIELDVADDEGYLREELQADDPAHANTAIGPLALAAVQALAGRAQ